MLFSGTSFSISIPWYVQDPPAWPVLLSVQWVLSLLQNSSPALLSALQEHPLPRCLEPCTWQQLAVPWQVLELSFADIYRAGSSHVLFTEVWLLCVQQQCPCSWIMGSLISLVVSRALWRERQGSSLQLLQCSDSPVSMGAPAQLCSWGNVGCGLSRQHRSIHTITAALPRVPRQLLCPRGFSEYLEYVTTAI